MQNRLVRKSLVIAVIVLFVGASIVPAISGNIDKKAVLKDDCHLLKKLLPDAASVSCYAFGDVGMVNHTAVLSYDAAKYVYDLFEELKYEMTHHPFTDKTESLKVKFVDILHINGLIPGGLSKEYMLWLLNPSWLDWIQNNGITSNVIHSPISQVSGVPSIAENFGESKKQIMDLPKLVNFQDYASTSLGIIKRKTVISKDEMQTIEKELTDKFDLDDLTSTAYGSTASAFFCSIGSGGVGLTMPLVFLPRPRLVGVWFSPEAITSVGRLFGVGGFAASGAQAGVALGFMGIGLTFAFPIQTVYGFVGNAVFTSVSAEIIERFPPNNAPVISDENPSDGSQGVPGSLSKLSFRIRDADGDRMSYWVTTEPDIGSGKGHFKKNGVYSVPVSGLQSNTEYSWHVVVSDGEDTTEKYFTFHTEIEAPIVSDPLPSDGDNWVSVDLTELSFTLKDLQGDLMDYTVETVPDIGSDSANGVDDGIYTVDVSGLDYTTGYTWFVNVTDGEHWTREVFVFKTQPMMRFDPFDEGWMYRKRITINHTKVAGDLDDFPVLISTVDSDLASKAQSDGDDVLFMDGSGVSNRLFHEIEIYDGDTGKLVAWVNVTSLSSSIDTTIWMYYGNSSCSSQEHVADTWDDHYKAVYHLADATDTLGNYNGTNHGVSFSGSKFGTCGDFEEGEDDYIDFAGNPTLSSELNDHDKTMELYVNHETNTGWNIYINLKEDGGASLRLSSSDVVRNSLAQSGYDPEVNWNTVSTGIWYYVVGTYDFSDSPANDVVELFINGSSVGTDSGDGTQESYKGEGDHIGAHNYGGLTMDGLLEEVRISDVVRSDDWILTNYNSLNNATDDGFFNVGPEETAP